MFLKPDEKESQYIEYLLTKLRLNPEDLSYSEVDSLRKIEFSLKLHDDVALKLDQPTILAKNMRVVYSNTNTVEEDPIREF